jgi:alpha-tubulin suppressor-like RCC1 family protein
MNLSLPFTSLTHHFLFVNEEGQLMVWGSNERGALGTGDTDNIYEPTLVEYEHLDPRDEIVKASCGVQHALLLTKKNLLLVSGLNEEGELGLGEGAESYEVNFQPLKLPVRISQVVAGALSSYALTEDGTIFAWGDNEYGQLGLGDQILRKTPQQIHDLPEIVQLAGGHHHMYAVTTDGTIYGWGRNNSGELGLGHLGDQLVPTLNPFVVSVIQLCCGSSHTLAVTSSGEVWSWGWNGYAALGRGQISDQAEPGLVLEGAAKVASGSSHCIARMLDGSFMVWGNNVNGQLGLGDDTRRYFPVPFVFPPEFPGGHEGVATFGTGCYNSFMLNNNGDLWIWGDPDEGKIGMGLHEDDRRVDRPTLLEGHKWKLPRQKRLEKFQEDYWKLTFRWLFQGRLDEGTMMYRLPTEVMYNMVEELYSVVVGW